MFPELNATDLWVASNAAGTLAFGILTLFLIVVDYRHSETRLFALACVISTLWFGMLTVAPLVNVAGPALDLTETLRTGAWLIFCAWLVPRVPGVKERRLLRSVAVVLPVALSAYLAWRLTVTFLFGSPSAGHSAVFAGGATLMSLWGLMLVEQVFRSASGDAQWALKYLCLGLGVLFVYDFVMYSGALLYGQIDLSVWDARGAVNALTVPLIAVSVRRASSWSARLGVSHAAAFRTGTMLAAGLYLLFVAGGSYYVRNVGGNWGEFAAVLFLTVAIIGLLVLVLSGQVRAHARVLINKHLFHYRYDYREAWLALTRRLSESDVEPYERVIRAVAQLLESPAGALWLNRDERYVCVSAWNMPPALEIVESADTQLMQFFTQSGWIVDVEEHSNNPAHYNNLELPSWLAEITRARLAIPLFAQSRLLGFLVLATPRADYRLGWEELDLLKALGRQVGVFLDQQESNRALTQARQFEAFNRLTAFLMHDLKNIAGQQSLMLQNAQRHKTNPEFVDDMILTIDNSVTRMRGLLAQLQRVSARETVTERVDVDSAIAGVVADLARTLPSPQVEGDACAATVNVDRERLIMVLRHIIRNAQDATPENGQVTIRAERDGKSVHISVSDTGEGMSTAFIRESLFQPFFSTKSTRGMGIGAYQARDFARAAGGDVFVESRVGKGTTFTLALPCQGETAVRDHEPERLEAEGE